MIFIDEIVPVFFSKGSAAMKLGDDDVRAIAAEARLSLTEEELAGAVRYVNHFFEMANRFKELDLKDVEPFEFADAPECPLRDDVPAEFGKMSDILADHGDLETSCFKVPRIMEE